MKEAGHRLAKAIDKNYAKANASELVMMTIKKETPKNIIRGDKEKQL